ncbi:hypothetical protein HPB47_020042 [Ixodes persulcatus]|uniref:Uncharacterized protein n=1 Tax=Ixodes persulcatus TaxID=34615 RepID=A0AC60QGC9_IXOPE|nr:hypothetical protein HPB47_020042 [Ixodes persulcatus]
MLTPGAVFSVWIAMEALTPIVGYVFGSQVYNACISFYPGLPYFIYVLFELYPLFSVVYCWFVYREQSCPCLTCPKDAEIRTTVGEDWTYNHYAHTDVSSTDLEK